jgi:hypothetical protein
MAATACRRSFGSSSHRPKENEMTLSRSTLYTLGAAVVAATVAAVGLVAVPYLRDQADEIQVRADRWDRLPQLIAAAGGPEALFACSRIRTAPDVRPLVAWELDLPMLDLDMPPVVPAVVLRWWELDGERIEPVLGADRDRFRLLARVPGWEALAACGRAPQVTS